jgi:4-hydroxy-tetrahydrodipicolinate reductase
VTSIALFGGGRMAAAIAATLRAEEGAFDEVQLQAVVAPRAPEWSGSTPWFSRLEELPRKPQVLVDFTLPDGTLAAAKWCAANGVALLSGVTGLQELHLMTLQDAGESVAVLWSRNLSLGVNLLAQLASLASAALPANTEVLVHDVHHIHKKDAPSGTALLLGEAITAVNPQRQPQYSSERVGEAIGEHRILLRWHGEEITLAHAALDRAVFARGALSAAEWLSRQPAGYYGAADWLSGLGNPAGHAATKV